MLQPGPRPIPLDDEELPYSPLNVFSAFGGLVVDLAVTFSTGSPPEKSFIGRLTGGGGSPRHTQPVTSKSSWGGFDKFESSQTMECDLILIDDDEELVESRSYTLKHAPNDQMLMQCYQDNESIWCVVESRREFTDTQIQEFHRSISQQFKDGSITADRILAGIKRQPGQPSDAAWIDNTAINKYFELRARKSKGKIMNLTSGSFSTLDVQIQDLASSKNQTVDAIQRALRDAEMIAWPVHQMHPVPHWNFAFLKKDPKNPSHYKIGVLDGFNNDYGFHPVIHQKAVEYLGELYGINFTYELFSIPIPRQSNAIDCGVLGAFYLLKLEGGDDLSEYISHASVTCDYSPFRYQLLQELADPIEPKASFTPAFSMQQQRSRSAPFSRSDDASLTFAGSAGACAQAPTPHDVPQEKNYRSRKIIAGVPTSNDVPQEKNYRSRKIMKA